MYGKLSSNKQISIILFLIISCIGISLIPIIIYGLLSIVFFTRGIDSVYELQLKTILNKYINDNHTNTSDNFISIIDDYNSLPEEVKYFLPLDAKDDILYKKVIYDNKNRQDNIYFIVIHSISGKRYYAIQKIFSNDVESYIRPQLIFTIYILFVSYIIILIYLIIVIKILLYRIKEPITKLTNWSTQLSYNNINGLLPNFTYPELQHIAIFIQKNLKKEYESLSKEEIFWRYCSHELRTPISTISVGIDYLQKLISTKQYDYDKYAKSLYKLRRAVFSMSQVINNILWLGRNEDAPLNYQRIELSGIIGEIINDISKIYINNNIKTIVKTSSFIVYLPPHILRIVLENIIRNAFQHSFGDSIFILQNKNKITVINPIGYNNILKENMGFGLGIEITARITRKFNWNFKSYKNTKFNIVKLILPYHNGII